MKCGNCGKDIDTEKVIMYCDPCVFDLEDKENQRGRKNTLKEVLKYAKGVRMAKADLIRIELWLEKEVQK